jgi:hypothetical protein
MQKQCWARWNGRALRSWRRARGDDACGGAKGPDYSELAMRNQFAVWRANLSGGTPRAA